MIEVDKNTFQTEVLEAEGYVFVDFFGDGCVPCRFGLCASDGTNGFQAY